MYQAIYLHRRNPLHRLDFSLLQLAVGASQCRAQLPSMDPLSNRANVLSMTVMVVGLVMIMDMEAGIDNINKCVEAAAGAAGMMHSRDEEVEEVIIYHHHQSLKAGLHLLFQASPIYHSHRPLQAPPSTTQWPLSWQCKQWACLLSPACPLSHHLLPLRQSHSTAKARLVNQSRIRSTRAVEITILRASAPAASTAPLYTKTASSCQTKNTTPRTP